VEEIFAKVGVRGWVHARCFDCGAEAGLGADEPVVLASVVKVPLVLEFARQVAAGQLDPAARMWARAVDPLGGVGTAGCFDDVELSLRDAASSPCRSATTPRPTCCSTAWAWTTCVCWCASSV
jgi:beta-lactamase class A